ncbi:MAG: Hpt domain-containing protein [Magnetococcales bacterium]|nr:Hpt domain-containing protein [Magnetococcales bacterium]
MDESEQKTSGLWLSLDVQEMSALRAEVGAGFGKLVDNFLEQLPGRVVAIDAAWQRRDGAQMALMAHRLKGVAATFGAARLSALALDLEGLARRAEWEQAGNRLPELSREARQVVSLVVRWGGGAIPGENRS